MEELEEKLRKEHGNLTYEEILELLEEEMFEDINNPYKPLNFHDDDESM
jgi:hypothetical protein